MLICNKEKTLWELFKDKLAFFCTAWYKLDPQGKRKGGGKDRACEEKRETEEDLKKKTKE